MIEKPDRLYLTVRSSVRVTPNRLYVGFAIYPQSKTLVIRPLPGVCFKFWIATQPKRSAVDTILEMMITISIANILSFVVAALIGYSKHREEVVNIVQYIIAELPFL